MQRPWRWLSGGAILAAAAVAVACSDASPTGPETAIPSLGTMHTQQIGACAEWSCAIADCTNDPAIYGPCCVQAVDEDHPNEQERPSSCEAPPGGGGGDGTPNACDDVTKWYCLSVPDWNYPMCGLCQSCGFPTPACGGA